MPWMPWGCERRPADGTFQANMSHMVNSSSSFINKNPTIHEATDDEDGRSVTDEEGEHNVENFMLCSFSHSTCSPLLQALLVRGGDV